MKTEEVSIPVISVGNITLGGTGKTPVVERLSMKLSEKGFKTLIASRGYKRKRKGIFCVDPDRDSAVDVGDEALMLARRTGLPVFVGIDRAAAITAGIERFSPDLAILDDGYQLRSLKKDMEILLVNGDKSGETDNIFPFGPNREHISRIKDADVLLIGKGRLNGARGQYGEGIPSFTFRYRPRHLYNIKRNLIGHFSYLVGKPVTAFSGLGDNSGFFELLRQIGATVVHEIPFPDHHEYSWKDLVGIFSHGDVAAVVTTEKDAVKLAGMAVPESLFYLSVDMEIDREEELISLITRILPEKGEMNMYYDA